MPAKRKATKKAPTTAAATGAAVPAPKRRKKEAKSASGSQSAAAAVAIATSAGSSATGSELGTAEHKTDDERRRYILYLARQSLPKTRIGGLERALYSTSPVKPSPPLAAKLFSVLSTKDRIRCCPNLTTMTMRALEVLGFRYTSMIPTVWNPFGDPSLRHSQRDAISFAATGLRSGNEFVVDYLIRMLPRGYDLPLRVTEDPVGQNALHVLMYRGSWQIASDLVATVSPKTLDVHIVTPVGGSRTERVSVVQYAMDVRRHARSRRDAYSDYLLLHQPASAQCDARSYNEWIVATDRLIGEIDMFLRSVTRLCAQYGTFRFDREFEGADVKEDPVSRQYFEARGVCLANHTKEITGAIQCTPPELAAIVAGYHVDVVVSPLPPPPSQSPKVD